MALDHIQLFDHNLSHSGINRKHFPGLAAIAPSGKAASAGGTFLFFPLMFFAGLWIPRAVMPATLRQIGDFTPLGAGVQALQDAAAGMWPHPLHLIVLAAYVLVFGAVASVVFRWE